MTALDEEFDFVVVGSGGGSMCSALVMRDAGRSVIILEKTCLIGGTTARSGGILWIPNNRFMKEHGIPDSREAATAYVDATSGQLVNAPCTTVGKRLAYIDHAPKMIDFLVSKGVRLRRPFSWPDYHDELLGGSVPGRTVGAELFDTRVLGAWQSKLRPAFRPLPATPDELQCLWAFKLSWKARTAMLRVALRIMGARLTGANVVGLLRRGATGAHAARLPGERRRPAGRFRRDSRWRTAR